VRNLATAIVTGGVLAGMSLPPTGQPAVASGQWQTMDLLLTNLKAQSATALIDSAINGTDLGDGLQQALIGALLNTVGAEVAQSIGDEFNGTMKSIAHAIAGCALGAAKTGDKGGCAPGAIGAVVGELTAQAIQSSPGMRTYLGNQDNVVYVSGVFAGLAGALTSSDEQAVRVANFTGSNAAANNALSHGERQQLDRAKSACYQAGDPSACGAAAALDYKDELTDRLLANAAAICDGGECSDVLDHIDRQLAALGCPIPAACVDEQTLLQYRRAAQEKAQGLEAVYPEGWLLDAKAALDLGKLGIKLITNSGKGALGALDDLAKTSADDLQTRRVDINVRRDDGGQYDHFRNDAGTAWDWQKMRPTEAPCQERLKLASSKLVMCLVDMVHARVNTCLRRMCLSSSAHCHREKRRSLKRGMRF